MVFEKITENIYIYKEKEYYDVVVGALVLPSKIVMIDTGIRKPKVKEFREYVESETKKKTEILFITHAHGDHTSAIEAFTDCRIIAAENFLEEENELNLTIETHDYLEIIDDDVKVIFKQTGGHTKESSYIYCNKYSVLFAGDNLFEDMYLYGQAQTADFEKWLEAFNEYQSLDAEYYIPGHQGVCTTKTIRGYIAFLNLMKTTIQEMHAEEKTKKEIIEEITPLKPFTHTVNDPKLDRLKNATIENLYNFWTKE